MRVSGNIVDVVSKRIFAGSLIIKNKKIKNIIEEPLVSDRFILPGFVDAHIHIESSMLTPVPFGLLAVRHGTVAVVTDPHEIANVLGMEGFYYMVGQAKKCVLKIKFGVPSCVPATRFETTGATITPNDIETLFRENKEYHLSEMMNYPGVIQGEKEVEAKINIAKSYHRIIDGHAPGVKGKELNAYVSAGITTDHECAEIEEARQKIKLGMKILIREGSAAKNFEELAPLIEEYPDNIMFCTDDAHPDDLIEKHIDDLVIRGIKKGYDFWNVLRAATYNPVRFYGLNVGLLQEGDPADFIICNDIEKFEEKEVYLNGTKVFGSNLVTLKMDPDEVINRFNCKKITTEQIELKEEGKENIQIIGAGEGSLFTRKIVDRPKIINHQLVSDVDRDILKIIVINRFADRAPAIGFIHGFGLEHGAVASSIAHDSHNIIALGTNDRDIVSAVNAVIDNKGGISVAYGEVTDILPLPVAGLMTNEDGFIVAKKYLSLNTMVHQYGCRLHSPFMTLSFMALLVIPSLKISDRGLFDVDRFSFTSLYV